MSRWIRDWVHGNGARGVKPWHTRRAAKQIRWANYLGMTFVAVSLPSLLLFLATPVVALVFALGCLGYAAPLGSVRFVLGVGADSNESDSFCARTARKSPLMSSIFPPRKSTLRPISPS